jgi:hypothetical protein
MKIVGWNMKGRSLQREYMRGLVNRYGLNEERVIHEYAEAEKRGDVERRSNTQLDI